MTGRVRVIRSRWWAEVLRVVGVACFAFLLTALWFGVFRDFNAPSLPGGLFLVAFGAFNLLVALMLIATFGLRVEVSSEGFRVASLLTRREFYWSEMVDIRPFPNFRLPGWHVQFRVDGSINGRRSLRGLGMARHYIPAGLEMGGIELAAYLNRRWKAWQRRQPVQALASSDNSSMLLR